ncbi:hypothetical protein HAX54_050512 [Datura stramonium]|uniref:Uncharacterized protein n=1 Tax=Datura stramonium TaxID=4076 RepID=A0ABS8SXG4_DATST|nr:hypothetical protein [Datura stramonium]
MSPVHLRDRHLNPQTNPLPNIASNISPSLLITSHPRNQLVRLIDDLPVFMANVIEKAMYPLRDSLRVTQEVVLARLISIKARVTKLEKGSVQEVLYLRADLEETKAVVIELQAKDPLVENMEIDLSTSDITWPISSFLGSPIRAMLEFPHRKLHLLGLYPLELHQLELLLLVLHQLEVRSLYKPQERCH